MEALEFLKERKRMCCSFGGSCEGCPGEKVGCVINDYVSDDDYKRIVATVEQWTKEHPRKTRQSVFLEQWTDAWTHADGVLSICPNGVADWHRSAFGTCIGGSKTCKDCRREFWMQEVE